ncbi:MAG: nitroreductase family protein [Coriobacteriales bacterium]|nr:nitroreductase family protein [Coriobacteriales bacterium]
MNGFYDLVLQARTYRRFDESQEVPLEALLRWVDCARLTPSAQNRQPLRYKITNDPDGCERVFASLKWAAALPTWPGPSEGERPRAYITICSHRANALTLCDVGIASQTIKLAAQNEGFGSCMFKNYNRADLVQAIGLDTQKYNSELVIAFGVPKEEVVVEPLAIDNTDYDYWRDSNAVHHVPKYLLNDILL